MAPARSNQPDSQAPTESSLPTSGNPAWLPADNKRFLTYLVEHRAEGGDGGNFKPVTHRAAAKHVNEICKKGGPKTGKSCGQKYAILRKDLLMVDKIKNTSGYHWDDKTGVTVDDTMLGSWQEYIKAFPGAARFKNAGWQYYDLMVPLMPSKAKGSHVFRAGIASQAGANAEGAAPRSSSPAWDADEMKREFGGGDKDDIDLDEVDKDGMGGTGGSPGDDEEEENEDVRPDFLVFRVEKTSNRVQSSSPIRSMPAPKCVAAQPAASYRKKPRMSNGAAALPDLAGSAEDFNCIFGGLANMLAAPTVAPDITQAAASTSNAALPLAPAPGFQLSPQRRTQAIHLAQTEDWLQPHECLALIKILRNVSQADMYIALLSDDICIPWVIDVLAEVGITVFHPMYSSFDSF
ncbi:hypothetical protein DFH07DRAFT_772102 [Mycena maculata]|uniref:Myb/SANT-like domain-containing protein n=1 Tax=Mycena maculata TaxID=230809 RepID=A0AAD7J8W1_9AGAR|nr:hypothetical protein DFH07DRAFT_772102 [Mycena maculata]